MRGFLWSVCVAVCVVVVAAVVSTATQQESTQSKIVVADGIQTEAITIVNKAGKPMMDLGCTPDGLPFIVLHGPYKYPLAITSGPNAAGIGMMGDTNDPGLFHRFFAGHCAWKGGVVVAGAADEKNHCIYSCPDERKEAK